jgi:hypothetical protein
VVGAQELLSRLRQLGVFRPPSVVAGLIVAFVAYLADCSDETADP